MKPVILYCTNGLGVDFGSLYRLFMYNDDSTDKCYRKDCGVDYSQKLPNIVPFDTTKKTITSMFWNQKIIEDYRNLQ